MREKLGIALGYFWAFLIMATPMIAIGSMMIGDEKTAVNVFAGGLLSTIPLGLISLWLAPNGPKLKG